MPLDDWFVDKSVCQWEGKVRNKLLVTTEFLSVRHAMPIGGRFRHFSKIDCSITSFPLILFDIFQHGHGFLKYAFRLRQVPVRPRRVKKLEKGSWFDGYTEISTRGHGSIDGFLYRELPSDLDGLI